VDQAKYLDKAILAVKEKKPLPEIDFSLHTMEDGTQVNTLERVCKGTSPQCPLAVCAAIAARYQRKTRTRIWG
jgi:hypothetical protein